jgi:serine/threonine protein kinase/tetratricopeptide (TPR) repeat protein
MPFDVGNCLGPYTILSTIGSGGMGHVYRALDPRLGREVAIKVLSDALANDPEALARFTREAHAVAALNHPSIVTIFSIEEVDGLRFITMELVEGRTLDRFIPPGGVTLDLFFDVAVALTDALNAAHRRRLVHRDLKPLNVMMSEDGRVKLLDFGLARQTDPEAERVADEQTHQVLTKEDTILGTAPYMAPEQIERKPIDARTDLFSLGIVLYEMATGTRPFDGNSLPSMVASILKDHPHPVAEQRPEIPEGVARLIERCLEKHPLDRVQTAAEILDTLKAERLAWASSSHEKPASRTAGRLTESAMSIAVLPFADLSAAKDQDWFCDGIAEEILNALASLEGLRVTARTSAFSFKGTSHDLRTIGQQLSVRLALEGSVRRLGDRVRVTAQLSDVGEGFQLWSARYDRQLKDIFDVQDEIAKAIAERLRLTLAGRVGDRLVAQATSNVDAYQCYLQGRALLNRRGANIRPAVELFRKAIELDPRYPAAWAAIADAYNVMAYLGFISGAEAREHALMAATRSIELNPASAAGHTALACARLMYENNVTVARKEFERALELNAHDVQSRCWYALLYLQWACGEFDHGIAEARRALESDPLSAYATMFLAACLSTAGHFDEAIESGTRAVERDAGSFVAHWVLGISLGMAQRFDEAMSRLELAASMTPQPSPAFAIMAVIASRSGRASEAVAIDHRLRERAAQGYVPLAHLVLTAEAAGRREEALLLARRAWEEREPAFILWARHFPPYETLRSDPRFADILREMDETG